MSLAGPRIKNESEYAQRGTKAPEDQGKSSQTKEQNLWEEKVEPAELMNTPISNQADAENLKNEEENSHVFPLTKENLKTFNRLTKRDRAAISRGGTSSQSAKRFCADGVSDSATSSKSPPGFGYRIRLSDFSSSHGSVHGSVAPLKLDANIISQADEMGSRFRIWLSDITRDRSAPIPPKLDPNVISQAEEMEKLRPKICLKAMNSDGFPTDARKYLSMLRDPDSSKGSIPDRVKAYVLEWAKDHPNEDIKAEHHFSNGSHFGIDRPQAYDHDLFAMAEFIDFKRIASKISEVERENTLFATYQAIRPLLQRAVDNNNGVDWYTTFNSIIRPEFAPLKGDSQGRVFHNVDFAFVINPPYYPALCDRLEGRPLGEYFENHLRRVCYQLDVLGVHNVIKKRDCDENKAKIRLGIISAAQALGLWRAKQAGKPLPFLLQLYISGADLYAVFVQIVANDEGVTSVQMFWAERFGNLSTVVGVYHCARQLRSVFLGWLTGYCRDWFMENLP